MGIFSNIPWKYAADYRYCRAIVQDHAENFPVASWLAPRAIRPHLHAVYAFARTADDFADLPGRSADERVRLLDDWNRRLTKAANGDADHPIFRALAYTLTATSLPVQPLFDLLIAFRLDITKKRYATFDELLDYCHYSANPVGRIFLFLSQQHTEENLIASDALCTALQLTNHLQDLGQDPYLGRPLYLPQEDMVHFGVAEELVMTRRFSPALGSLILQMVERTRDFYAEGEQLLPNLTGRLRLELTLTWNAGLTVLEKIEALGGNTLRERPKLEARDWMQCFFKTLSQTIAS